MPNLNFDGENTLYTTHGLHAFAAKCPPQLVKYGLRYYSKRGDIVLDPMIGSGTTAVECNLMMRSSIGFDIDPFSALLAKVKSTPLCDDSISVAAENVYNVAKKDFEIWQSNPESPTLGVRAIPPDFYNRDYWFDVDVAAALSLISYHIENVPKITKDVRDFLWIAFSSLILAKTSVANARDIVHSRHHHWEHEKKIDVFVRFRQRIKQMRRHMREFMTILNSKERMNSRIDRADARSLPVQDETIDLVFTSPPYVTALDYPRAHFLAIPWMKNILGVDNLAEYMGNAPTYVGSERGRLPKTLEIDRNIENFALSQDVLHQINCKSKRQAILLQRYMLDMQKVLCEISRVLKSQKHAIIVVCPSHMRKVNVPTQDILIEIAQGSDLRLKKKHTRTISNRKRILPYMQEAFGKRMSTEYVLILQKK